MLTVYSVYTVGLHDNIGTWYTSNEKKCVCSRKKVLISGMRKESLVAVFLLLIIDWFYGENETKIEYVVDSKNDNLKKGGYCSIIYKTNRNREF